MKKPAPRKTPTPLPSWSACLPPAYELGDVQAFQALERGAATEGQQKRALAWIIQQAAGTYDQSYRPGGEEGRRDSDFAEGRRFVGNQIVKLLRLNLGAMRRIPEAMAHEPES